MFYQNRLYTKNARNAAKLSSKVEINIRNNPIPNTCWDVRNVIGDATENKMVLIPQCCEDAYLLTISDPGYIPVHLLSTHGNDDALQDNPLKRPNPALKLS